MHYFIDGYNLLFRMKEATENLQSGRESIIASLNKKLSLVKLHVSLVFDSTYQIGDRTRTHFEHLEILFTAHGETADEYILDELKNISSPHEETVVTSDKALAWKVRHQGAHSESVEAFLEWLNRAYKNKLKQKKREPKKSLFAPLIKQRELIVIPDDAPLEAYESHYAKIFEAEWELLQIEEKKKKEQQQAIEQSKQSQKPRQPRKKLQKDPFSIPEIPEPTAATEMERWLKLFERR